MSRCKFVFVTSCAAVFALAGCTAVPTNAGSSLTRSTFNNATPASGSPAPVNTLTGMTITPASTPETSLSVIVFERPTTTAAQTESAPTATLTETNVVTPSSVAPTNTSTGTARQAAVTHTHPAALALLNEATRQEKSGELEMAAAKLERALKIEPRSALLWHKLANLRLRQGQNQLAANLAAKSNSYTTSDDELVDLNQKIIARAKSR